MSKIIHILRRKCKTSKSRNEYVSTFCPDKLTWITRGLLSTTMLIIFCWWWISWKVSWLLWLWRHCATLPVVCVEIPLFPYILTFKVLHRYDSLFESWYFLDSLSFEWHALNVANTLHSTFQKYYDCCREKYIVFLQNIDLIVRRRRQKIYFISFMIKFSSDQQCQNVISWLWPNLVIACWLCGSVPSNGKYLMIAIHRTKVRYDARPWPSAFKCNDQSRAGLCQPEVECVLAQFGHGNKINMFLFSPV